MYGRTFLLVSKNKIDPLVQLTGNEFRFECLKNVIR